MKRWPKPERVVFVAFLFWLAAGLILTPLRLSAAEVEGWRLPGFLADFIGACLRYGDPILMILAAINTHCATSRHWGRAAARRWGLIALLTGAVVESVGTLTGEPFGPYRYTDRFGPLIFDVLPMTIPLAWFVIVTNLLLLTRQMLPYASAPVEALAAAALATLVDFIMEPFAVSVKAYWIWFEGSGSPFRQAMTPTSHVPVQNYVSWFAITFLLVRLAAPTFGMREEKEPRPAVVAGGIVALFVVSRIASAFWS